MRSKRITLISCDIETIRIILKGNGPMRKQLGINVPDQWTEFGTQSFHYTLDKIQQQPGDYIWWTYLPVLTESNILIGSCGFKGPPDHNGLVEIGYEVAKAYRNQGFATEITGLLLKKAFTNNDVLEVQAHTMPQENASVRVLTKNGFVFKRVIEIAGDEKIWRWSINKDTWIQKMSSA